MKQQRPDWQAHRRWMRLAWMVIWLGLTSAIAQVVVKNHGSLKAADTLETISLILVLPLFGAWLMLGIARFWRPPYEGGKD